MDHSAYYFDTCANAAALAQHLDELIAELRDRGVTPRPPNVLQYALELGLPKAVAMSLAARLEHRIQLGGAS
jgi:hypothetical protein